MRLLAHARRSIRAVFLAVLLIGAIGVPAAPPARAQTDAAATVIRDAHAFIMEYALRPVEPQLLLQRAIAAVQQIANPVDSPPVLTGNSTEDMGASASFIASALRALPAAQHEAGLAAALRAMIRELNDPFAAAFTPAEFRRFQEELRGERAGIGAQVDSSAAGEIVVSDITPGGPAAREGVQPGDVIEQVDGRSTLALTPDEVLALLRGAAGSPVALTLRRGSVPRRAALPRAVVRENATRSRLVQSRVGYVRLLEFSRQSARDLARAVAALRTGGAQVLILDLRANGGGLVDEAVDIASTFLTDGAVAFEERRGGTEMLGVRDVERFTGGVILLADRASASAAEIVAGALQDVGAPLVGLPTYGKTAVQSVSIPPLADGWGLRVTTARYLTRAKRNIEGTGLTPTVRISMDARLIQSAGDVQFREALALARARLTARTSP